MPYRRSSSKRSYRRSATAGRDYFWAAPVQRVGRGGSDFGPFSVARPGWSSIKASGSIAQNDRLNFSNGLSRVYNAHGATSFQREDSREARLRDRPWRIHYFEGTITVAISSQVVKAAWFASEVIMGAAVSIPREEGSNVPSGIIGPEDRQAITLYYAVFGSGSTVNNPANSQGVHRRSFSRMPIRKTLNPDQDWLINWHANHIEGDIPVGACQMLVHGRFRCSRT